MRKSFPAKPKSHTLICLQGPASCLRGHMELLLSWIGCIQPGSCKLRHEEEADLLLSLRHPLGAVGLIGFKRGQKREGLPLTLSSRHRRSWILPIRCSIRMKIQLYGYIRAVIKSKAKDKSASELMPSALHSQKCHRQAFKLKRTT